MKKASGHIAHRMERAAWLSLGFLALGLGGLGTVLPVLPTTPFVLLAAFAFGKSAPRLRTWLEDSRAFGSALADWRAHGAIALRFKVMALGMMASAFSLSLVLSKSSGMLALQFAGMAGAAAFILSRPGTIAVPAPSRSDRGEF